MSKKSWIIFIVIVVGLLTSLVIWSKNSSVSLNISGVDPNVIQTASDSNGNTVDHTDGKQDSKIVLIEYGDFQCPPCGNAHPIIKSLVEKYSDKILFIFRNFPIPSLHPNARAAAAAAEAAGLQGKYWEMHNMIFENQSEWSSASATDRTNIFEGYAKTIGLDTNKFTSDLALSSIIKKIDFDIAIGKSVGVSGTPTFTLNGEKTDLNNLESSITSRL